MGTWNGSARRSGTAGRPIPGRFRPARLRPLLAAALLAGLIAAWSGPAALAREGVYAGLGVGTQSVSDGIAGTTPYPDASGLYELRPGKPQDGSGIAFNGGFGFNEYLALDLLIAVSRHGTLYDPPGGPKQTYDARLSSVLFGVRLGAPLGDLVEVFGRAGLGGYELTYRDNNTRLADQKSVDDARFSGRGVGAGVGAELFLGHWGVQLAYTAHKADFNAVQSLNHSGLVTPSLSATLATVTLLINYYLQ